jgi:hypothetical protein
MAKEQSDYLSYLLRLWRVNEEGNLHRGAEQAVWRASLENPHTRQRQGFASLDELFDFLREQIRMASEPATSGAEQNSKGGLYNE